MRNSETTVALLPLCVDLDGTLLKTDMLLETFILLLKKNIFYIFLVPLWLLQGKAFLKKQIAERVSFAPLNLPYNLEFLTFLKNEYTRGRKLVLVTASDYRVAEKISSHLALFQEVLASNGSVNLSGKNKLAALVHKFGAQGFDYAANGKIDLAIWPHAKNAIVVGAPLSLANTVSQTTPVSQHFPAEPFSFSVFLKALRVHQWLKNLLIFVPLVLAHKLTHWPLLLQAGYAFISFGLCASAIYLLNDLLDLEADRAHSTKKSRPLAAGQLPLTWGFIMIPIFLLGSVLVAFHLPIDFLVALGIYFLTTTAYSFYLKQVVLVDVLVLAGLYTLRIIAGAAAVSVVASQWLLAFSLFLFLSLALLKRFSELQTLRLQDEDKALGRGYLSGDLEQIASFGAASGYIAVLVLALYVNSREVLILYPNPGMLWLLCPLFLYWISHLWLLAHRGLIFDDPILFAVKDKPSYVVAIMIGGIMLIAL